MKKLILLFTFLVGLPLEAQTRIDIQDCIQEFFDNLSDLNQNMPGEPEEIDKVRVFQRIYQGEFFDFNGRNDVSINEFLSYYKTHVLGNSTVTHDIVSFDWEPTSIAKESHSYRLSNVKIRRKFEGKRSPSSTVHSYTDEISCNMLVTWMGEDANPRIRINGISYTEPLEKAPQVIATKRTPVFKVSNANASVSAYSGSHRVSVTSYCDTEYIYTNGKSRVKRDTLAFKVIGDKYEVNNNEVRFNYSSNPNRHNRTLTWTLVQSETGQTCYVKLQQKKRKIEVGLFDFEKNTESQWNLHYIPNGMGFSFMMGLEDTRWGVGMSLGFPLFNKPLVDGSGTSRGSTTVNYDDGSSALIEIQSIDHSEVTSSSEIKVINDLSFYSFVGLLFRFSINSYLDIEYAPLLLNANHRYDLDGYWYRITTTRNYNGNQDVFVDYGKRKEDSEIQRIWCYDNYKLGFMNRFGVRAFIPLGDDLVINIGYGYYINTIKGVPNFSDLSIGIGITY